MTTSVKMRPEDKAALGRLQAELVARTGRKESQQDLLARLVRLGQDHVQELIDEDAPLTEEEVQRALKRLREIPQDFGFVTSHEEIDEILYGGDDLEADPH